MATQVVPNVTVSNTLSVNGSAAHASNWALLANDLTTDLGYLTAIQTADTNTASISAQDIDIDVNSASAVAVTIANTAPRSSGSEVSITTTSGQTAVEIVAGDLNLTDGDVTASGTVQGGTVTDGTFSTTSGAVTGVTTLAASDDVSVLNPTNDGNPVLTLGATTAEALVVTATYDSGAQTLEKVIFATKAASVAADKGAMEFQVDEALVMTLEDAALKLADGAVFEIDTSEVLSETTLGSTVLASSLTSTGALTGGSIASGFGTILTGNSIQGTSLTDATATLTGGNLSGVGTITGATTLTLDCADGSDITIAVGADDDDVLDCFRPLNMNSKKITSLATPTADADAATKAYVDGVAEGLRVKDSVRLSSTTALTVTYANGTAGVGATLTNADTQAALSLDGVAAVAGDRIMIKDQGDAEQNGVYTVTDIGSGSTNWVLTRATDFDESDDVPSAFFFIEEGSTNADRGYVCTTNDTVTLGTTDIVFAQFSGAGTFTAGANGGLVVSGGAFSMDHSNLASGTVATTARIGIALTGAFDTPVYTTVGDTLDLISGDVNVSTTGASTITANAVEGSMINSNVAGTGLEYDSSTLRLAAAAAGNGLTGGGGVALAVGAGANITVNADDVALSTSITGMVGIDFTAATQAEANTDLAQAIHIKADLSGTQNMTNCLQFGNDGTKGSWRIYAKGIDETGRTQLVFSYHDGTNWELSSESAVVFNMPS